MSPNGAITERRARAPQVRPTGRYGRSVRALTVVLPLISVVTAGSLVHWWIEAHEHRISVDLPTGTPPTNSEVILSTVEYDYKDEKGRPFSITADSASHIDGDDRHISFKKPLADIVMSNGAYVALAANDSILDREADIVTLNGDVTLFHDNGLSFQTDSATIDLNTTMAEGNDVVVGQNGDGELVSQGFRVLDDGDTIVFTGQAYMKIYPKQKDQGG